MKKYCALFFILLSVSLSCSANKIDSIQTPGDVVAFIKAVAPGYAKRSSLDTLSFHFDLLDKKIADSLKIRVQNMGHWLKTDLNNDGQTDLLLFGVKGFSKIFAVVVIGNKYVTASFGYSQYHDVRYETKLLPELIIVNNQKAVAVFHYEKEIQDGPPSRYRNIGCDTVVFRNNKILSFQGNPNKYGIEEIVLDDNGSCEGDCPVMHIVVDLRSGEGKYSVKYRSPPYKSYEGVLAKEKVSNVANLSEYTNFPDLVVRKDSEVYVTDLTTATWIVTYDHGLKKTIVDYGQMGNATLTMLYNFIVGDLPFENKQ